MMDLPPGIDAAVANVPRLSFEESQQFVSRVFENERELGTSKIAVVVNGDARERRARESPQRAARPPDA